MSKAERRQSTLRWLLWLAVTILAGAGVIYLLIWYGPDVLARHDVGNIGGARLQEARDAARGRLLTLGAGLFAAGALIFTARNYQVARQTLEVAEQGQVTDRYAKAVEQLGSDKLDVRIGGIYALERVAFDSAKDHPIVIEVLAAFIRVHSHERLRLNGSHFGQRGTARPDVHAALTVILRRNREHDIKGLDLKGAYLHRADLVGADLTGADLTGAKLTSARLVGANLTGAKLPFAKLGGAKLTGADFTGAKLTDLFFLEDPTYTTNYPIADIWGDWLVKDSRAKFSTAELTGVRWPDDEEVPANWERDPESRRLARDKYALEVAARLVEQASWLRRRQERKGITDSGRST